MVGEDGVQDILLQNMVPWHLGKQIEEGNSLSPCPFSLEAGHTTLITEVPPTPTFP